MRVLINGWFADRAVGSGTYTVRLAAALTASAGEDDRFEVTPAPSRTGRFSKLAFEQWGFPSASRGFDLAHVPYWAPPLVPGAPTVVTVHDLIPLIVDDYRRHTSVRLYSDLVSRASRGARAIIADSEHTAADITKHLPVDDTVVHVVPLGVDESFAPAASEPTRVHDRAVRESLGLPERFGLYVGGFDHRKNLGTLFEAWRTVHDQARVPLVAVGDPPPPGHPWATHPEEVAESAGLPTGALLLVGGVPLSDLPSLYRTCSVFLYPSRYEGFGLPPLEALACGAAVVCSNATSLPEVVGDAGVLVDPDDADTWASNILQVLEDDTVAERLRTAAPEHARQFTWAETARLTRAVYESVLTGPPSS